MKNFCSKLIILFLPLLFTFFGTDVFAQVSYYYNSQSNKLTLNYSPDNDANNTIDTYCLQGCYMDQYYGDPISDCDEECGNVQQVEYYFLGFYSPFVHVSPLNYSPDFVKVTTLHEKKYFQAYMCLQINFLRRFI